MTRKEAINVIKGWVLADRDREALETILPELKKDKNESIKEAIMGALEKYYFSNTVFNGYSKKEMISWIKKQIPPKWLYRLEYKDGTCGLWYNGEGKWCFEQGIGSLVGCKTKDLPMDHDERYKQEGRDWFSSCSRKEDLMHWYSLKDAEELIKKGFVFTRYVATEYHEYENETVFIKESSLVREEIDIFELFGKTKPMFKEGDWIIYRDEWTREVDVLMVSNPDPNGTSLYTVRGEQKYYLEWNSLKSARLWKLDDAISGDILSYRNGQWIFIYEGMGNEPITIKYYVLLSDKGIATNNYCETILTEGIKPATKKERDLLFTKLKETGYEWEESKLMLINLKESDIEEENDWKFVESSEKSKKPKDISEFLQRLTTEEQEFLWEHIEKVKKLEREDIMKGAIEARVENCAFYGVKPEIRIRPESGYKTGDKVKVIIIKES